MITSKKARQRRAPTTPTAGTTARKGASRRCSPGCAGARFAPVRAVGGGGVGSWLKKPVFRRAFFCQRSKCTVESAKIKDKVRRREEKRWTIRLRENRQKRRAGRTDAFTGMMTTTTTTTTITQRGTRCRLHE